MATLRAKQPKRSFRKAQAATDAQLDYDFEQQAKVGSAGSWDYLQQTLLAQKKNPAVSNTLEDLDERESKVNVPAYLQHVQRPGFIQPHGTLLLLQEKSFKVLAVAENVWDYLDNIAEMAEAHDLLGMDALSLFSPQSAQQMEQALQYVDVSLANPLAVYTSKTDRALYAILHRVEEGIVVDIEPQWGDDLCEGNIRTLDKHDRASASIAQLQSCDDMPQLCNTLVQEVKTLTGYDRVMLYKFHEDLHGEVIAEAKEDSLPSLLGLHYPANDVPQANRQLFVDVRLRMIADTKAGNVNIIQDPSVKTAISLSRSTLRGVAGCHKEYCQNMGCSGTLVMAVVVSVDPQRARNLWGLVCCHHHAGPRTVSYPQRYASDFLIQAFAVQLTMEMEAAEAAREKRVLHMQAVLCGMLTRDAPLGLIRQSPNIRDLVPADGAVLMHDGAVYVLGTAPTEEQILDLAKWLQSEHMDVLSQGVFVTNSLEAAGYPRAAELAPAVCGLAAAMVSPHGVGDHLMWFRSGISKAITWAGHTATHAVKEGANMHPRVSFDAYLEVARLQSLPWQDAEIDAMQGLKLIVRDSLPEKGPQELRLKIQTQLNAERLRIQNQVMQMARSLQAELESARTPIIGLWGSGGVSEWNAKAAELTKRPKTEVLGLSFPMDLLVEESREAFRQAMDLVAEGEEVKPIDIILAGRSMENGPLDREVHIVTSVYGHHDIHGNLVGVRMVAQDITALKVLSGEYAVAAEEARATLDQSDMLVFAVDDAGRIKEWNTAMERITGLPRERVFNRKLIGDVLSSSPMLVVPEPDSLVHFEIALCQALNGHDTRNHEFHFNTWDGKQMDTLMHIISRKGEHGEALGATCFMQDMMERRAAENASAVRMVAEAAAQAKTMQLAFLCHEIRNPLNGILSSISFMEDTDMTSEQRDLVYTTAACGKYLRRIVDDVLDLSKIEEGKLEIEGETFLLTQVVDTVVAQEASNAFEKGLRLYCTIDPACIGVAVEGDHFRVQQIIANFARNAVEYTGSGWVEIKLKAEKPTEKDNFRCVFRVSDSGKGLSAEQKESIFSMPEQLASEPPTARTVPGGTGLGLVVCRKLASLMGGTVHCDTMKGVGSSFSLDLELPRAGPQDEPAGEGQQEGDHITNRQRGVIYTTVGEWSSPAEVAEAEFRSPTALDLRAEADRGAGAEHASPPITYLREGPAPAERPLWPDRELAGQPGERPLNNIPKEEEDRRCPSQESSDVGEVHAAVGAVEQAFQGRVCLQVKREVVDWREVAVLVEVEVLDTSSGTSLAALQEWGSAHRAGSLGETLRAATQNAVVAAAQALVAPLIPSQT